MSVTFRNSTKASFCNSKMCFVHLQWQSMSKKHHATDH